MKADKEGLSFWLWIAGAFFVLLIAWGSFFYIASKNRVEEVPLPPLQKAVRE